MTDWRRKHVSSLADACKQLTNDESMVAEHRLKFADTYAFVKQFSSLPGAGEGRHVMAVIERVYDACRTAV